ALRQDRRTLARSRPVRDARRGLAIASPEAAIEAQAENAFVIAARIAAIALVLGARAHNPVVPGVPKVVPKVALAPYAMHEDCVELVPNDRLEYRFESSEPVAF